MPSSGRTRPAMARNSVVLPVPLGPVSTSASPGFSPIDSPRSRVRPPRERVRLWMFNELWFVFELFTGADILPLSFVSKGDTAYPASEAQQR